MPSVTLSIPTPIVASALFHVEIKDGGGSVVYTNDVDNSPFTVTLASGNYEAFYTFDGNTEGWCFTIPSCGCVAVISAEIIERSTMAGNYDLVFVFDFAGYTPTNDCGYQIRVSNPDGGGFDYSYGYITGTHLSGTQYEKSYFLGTNSSTTYAFYKTSAPAYETGEVCVPPTNIDVACHGAFEGTFTPPAISLVLTSGVFSLDISYNSCGSTCNTVVWNYYQKNVTGGIPDNGTFTDIITCSPLHTSSHAVTPGGSFLANGGVIYELVGIDCCGNEYRTTANICTPLISFADWNLGSQPINSNIRITVTACEANAICPVRPFTIQWTQQASNVAIGSIPDSGTGVMTVNCSSLPDIHDFVVHPAPLAVGKTQAKYDVSLWGCCLNSTKPATISP